VTAGASRVSGPLERVRASFGYDEISWTAAPRGRVNTAAVREMFGGPAVVRTHNLLTSGNGRGLPRWSSGNVYHGHDGQPVYDWGQAGPVFGVRVGNGMIPLAGLGFCPVQLASPLPRAFRWSPSLYGGYESWGWSSPPRDEARWAGLIEAVAGHFARRYGQATVAKWYWELWNEPDISYWQGTVEEYCRLRDVTASAGRCPAPWWAARRPPGTGRSSPAGSVARRLRGARSLHAL
jgi:xylan 1,4-beta-xylosidase